MIVRMVISVDLSDELCRGQLPNEKHIEAVAPFMVAGAMSGIKSDCKVLAVTVTNRPVLIIPPDPLPEGLTDTTDTTEA